jgi:crotonobetainyl-CoA:carnitine CoA-transferase CaiB-like acyl-CoA transferase
MAPFGAYPTNDGWVAICAPSDPFMSLLADGMGAPELMDDARFASRSARTANRVELDARIEQWTRTLPTDDVVSRLTELGVPTAEVRTPGDAILDPRVRAREAVVPLRHPIHGATADAVGTGIPIRFSRSRAGFEGLDAPFLGQHNHVVFGELLGKDADTLDRLYREGII